MQASRDVLKFFGSYVQSFGVWVPDSLLKLTLNPTLFEDPD